MHSFSEIGINPIFWGTVLAWTITQTIKVCLGIIRTKKFDFRWFVNTGGMPSAHTAGVVCLAVSIGLRLGFDSPVFAVTAVFTMITMFDAQGVRRAAGHQAGLLNKMLDDIYAGQRISEERLKELLGHTPLQVLVGAALGALLAIIFNLYIWPQA
ncbi:MAG: divergent PAP2 family protein [Candidatus Omnitrophica bacterium]|nr:divergent PAP2 family protein [Candidatus Omnitrophota bacterium]